MTVLDQLGLFRDRAEELKNTRFIKDGYSPNITIKLDRMEGSRFISKEPNEEDLRSFLLTFRQFVSPKEPVFLNRIYNLCQKAITSEMLRDYLILGLELLVRMINCLKNFLKNQFKMVHAKDL